MSRIIDRYLAPVYLLLCLTLGGASAAGFLANGVLQILGLLCVLAIVLSGALPELSRPARTLLMLFAAAGALLIFELVPLPPFLWELLPGRGLVADGFDLMGSGKPWLPISLSSDGTLGALMALVPPVAMVILVYASSGYGRLYCVYALVAGAVFSIFLGIFQKVQGPTSAYYFYEVTNRGGVVGFFANRNHLATLLLVTLPFIGTLAVSPRRGAKHDPARAGRPIITGCIALLIATGVVIVSSAAGWLLLPLALFAAVMVFVRGEYGAMPRWLLQAGAVVGLVCCVAAVVAPIQVNDLGDKLNGIDPHMRNVSIRTTAAAALEYLPFGSGGGTFQLIYPLYEDPNEASIEYMNHAHDEYVEIALEHGLPGVLLLGAAIMFWFTQTRRLWRRGEGNPLARVGTIGVGLILAHSLVDYPARTAAMAAVGAFVAALMVAPEALEMPVWQSKRKRQHRVGVRTIEIALAD